MSDVEEREHRETGGEAERQTERQTETQTERQTETQTDKHGASLKPTDLSLEMQMVL